MFGCLPKGNGTTVATWENLRVYVQLCRSSGVRRNAGIRGYMVAHSSLWLSLSAGATAQRSLSPSLAEPPVCSPCLPPCSQRFVVGCGLALSQLPCCKALLTDRTDTQE